MIEAIVKEITSSPSLLFKEKGKAEIEAKKNKEIISTLYFGGGTPSILDINDLQLLFTALKKRFVFADDIEITLEANPDDITDIKLQEWCGLFARRPRTRAAGGPAIGRCLSACRASLAGFSGFRRRASPVARKVPSCRDDECGSFRFLVLFKRTRKSVPRQRHHGRGKMRKT